MSSITNLTSQPSFIYGGGVEKQTISQTIKATFEKIKEFFYRLYKGVVRVLSSTSWKIQTGLSCAVRYVSPSWGDRFDAISLRVLQIWESVKSAKKEEALYQTQEKCIDLESRLETLKNADIKAQKLARDNQGLQDKCNYLETQLTLNGKQVEVADQSRDVLYVQNKELVEQNSLIRKQLEEVQSQLEKSQNENQDLLAKLGVIETSLAHAQAQLKPTKELEKLVEEIGRVCQQTEGRPKGELDDDLEQIIPLLLEQLDQTIDSLRNVSQKAKSNSSEKLRINRSIEILTDLQAPLAKVPNMLKLHTQWSTSLGQGLLNLKQGAI